MQITPLPVPIVPNTLQPDVVARATPQIQAQASAPVIQRAVDPSSRSDRGNQTRSNGDKAKGGGSDGGGNKVGGSVNLKV